MIVKIHAESPKSNVLYESLATIRIDSDGQWWAVLEANECGPADDYGPFNSAESAVHWAMTSLRMEGNT